MSRVAFDPVLEAACLGKRYDEVARWRLTQHRFMIFGRPAGPWHDYLELAERDALRQRMASRDPHSGIVYVTVPGWFASRDAGWVCRPGREMAWRTSTLRESLTAPAGGAARGRKK